VETGFEQALANHIPEVRASILAATSPICRYLDKNLKKINHPKVVYHDPPLTLLIRKKNFKMAKFNGSDLSKLGSTNGKQGLNSP